MRITSSLIIGKTFPHSSAKYYIAGEQGAYKVINYCELADIDLTKSLEKKAESTANTQGLG